MKLSNAQLQQSSETHLMGTATLIHKSGEDEVFFVAPVSVTGKVFEEGDAEAYGTQYHTSKFVAEVAFKDLSRGEKLLTSLKGQDLPSLTEHCIRNTRR